MNSVSKNNNEVQNAILGIVGIIGFVVLWQMLAVGPLSESPLPKPTDIFFAGIELMQSSTFWESFYITSEMAVKGLVLAILAGTLIGVLAGWFRFVGDALYFIVEFLKPIPPIVIMPLVILVLGPTQSMGEFLVVYGSILPIIYQTTAGVKETDPVLISTSRSYGVSEYRVIGRVVLPSAMSFTATAVRVAIPMSLMITVAAGLLGGAPGLGQLVSRALSANTIPSLYALVLLLGVLGLILQFASEKLEKVVLKWHPSYRVKVN